MKLQKYLILVCAIALAQNFLYADDQDNIAKYNAEILKSIAGKSNLTMVIGAGDQDPEYERFKSYNFLLNDRSNKDVTDVLVAQKIQSVLDAYQENKKNTFVEAELAAKRPLPIILDFTKPEFLVFFDKQEMHERFSEIIFDLPVVHLFPKATENWLHVISNALNNNGKFTIDYKYVASIPMTWFLDFTGQNVKDFEHAFGLLSIVEEKQLKGIPDILLTYGGTEKISLLENYDDIKFPELIAKSASFKTHFNNAQTRFKTLKTKIIEHDVTIFKNAGFEVVQEHYNQPYPLAGKKSTKTRFYVAYKKDKLHAYHEKVVEFFKGKNNLSMILGAGNQLEDYPRFSNYTFLVCNDKENSLKAFNDYRKSLDPEHKEVQSLLDINLAQTPIPLILDFNDKPAEPFLRSFKASQLAKSPHVLNYKTLYASPLSKFLNKLPKQFSKIMFDYSVTKSLKNDNIFWLQSIYKALNDSGVFIMDDLSSGLSVVISSKASSENYCAPLSLPNITTASPFALGLQIPISVSILVPIFKNTEITGGKNFRLPTQDESIFDENPEGSWISSEQLKKCNQQIIHKNKVYPEFNKLLLQKAGFGLVEIHKTNTETKYPANNPSYGTEQPTLFYKAYKTDPAKKDPVQKLITSLEALKTSLAGLSAKLKTLANGDSL